MAIPSEKFSRDLFLHLNPTTIVNDAVSSIKSKPDFFTHEFYIVFSYILSRDQGGLYKLLRWTEISYVIALFFLSLSRIISFLHMILFGFCSS